MALINEILGHENISTVLVDRLMENSLPHAMGFVGPEGVGKKKVALALAQYALCIDKAPPCGHCGSCRRVAQLQSEALLLIKPDGAQIKLDQAHEVTEFLALRSQTKRFVLIDDAHLMNSAFANSLLKIFEEPPLDTHFILVTPSLSALLPTIRSRLTAVRFFALPEHILRSKSETPWMIKASRGSFKQLEQLSQPELTALRQKLFEALNRMRAKPTLGGFEELHDEIRDREKCVWLVRWMQQFFRDTIALAEESADVIHRDQEAILRSWVNAPRAQLFDLWKRSFQMEQEIPLNVDRTLLFDNFCVEFLKNAELV